MGHDRPVNPIEETLPEVPTDVDPDRLLGVVDEVAEMNSDDWSTIEDNGAAAAVRLEFTFSAPNEPAAAGLADDLLSEGYEAATAAPEGEYDEWAVKGTTPEVSVSATGLREWTRRLAGYGLDHDGCVLDGWAASLG